MIRSHVTFASLVLMALAVAAQSRATIPTTAQIQIAAASDIRPLI